MIVFKYFRSVVAPNAFLTALALSSLFMHMLSAWVNGGALRNGGQYSSTMHSLSLYFSID